MPPAPGTRAKPGSSLARRLAILFLRSTARGPLVEALPAEPPDGFARLAGRLRLSALLRAVGRLGGRLLTPAAKARVQDALINRYRIPVNLQRDERRLGHVLRRALQRLKARHGHQGVGDYLEFGVYQGNSLIQAHRALAAEGLEHVRLFGFDSFAGLPQDAAQEGVWSPGQYRADVDFTRQRLAEHGVDPDRTVLVPGFFADTLTEELREEHGVEQAGVIMIDCDLYSSAKEALAFCKPLIGSEAVVLFDDWHAAGEGRGEQRALAEFLEENPELEAEPFDSYNETSQAFVLKRVGAWLGGLATTLEEGTLALDWLGLCEWAGALGRLAC